MKRRLLVFTAPGAVEVRDEPLAAPGAGEVLVETLSSAISPGTELLLFRGEAPAELDADATLGALAGPLSLPRPYGYAAVGVVRTLGAGVEPAWQDRRVFAFVPHASHFVARHEHLYPVPDALTCEVATLLASMETAVGLVMDAEPVIGERVVVFGQGLIGLLVTHLLARFPLARLVTVEPLPGRRAWSKRLGAQPALDPAAADFALELARTLGDSTEGEPPTLGADLCFELSGRPATLDAAIASTADYGRVVIGSWYGQKRATLDLGGRFHRSGIELVSSQVSRLAPRFRGRFSKRRRLETAWRELAATALAGLITHRVPLADAASAYRRLIEQPDETIGVVLTYDDE